MKNDDKEVVGWMTDQGIVIRGDIALIVQWKGAFVGSGRAIPDKWIPFLWTDRIVPNDLITGAPRSQKEPR